MKSTLQLNEFEYHPGFHKGNEALALAQSFLENGQVSFFGVARLYDDNQFGFCFSDNRVAKIQFSEFLEPIALARFRPEDRKDSFHFMNMDQGRSVGLADDLFREVRNETPLKHSVSVTKRFLGYTDMFALSLIEANQDPSNFYYSNQNKIKLLFHHLYDRGASFLREITQSTIIQNIEATALPKDQSIKIRLPHSLTFSKNGKTFQFTPTQYKILGLLAKGYSSKMIAQIRNISPRTVETHLETIKAKTSLRYKDDLAFWFNSIK